MSESIDRFVNSMAGTRSLLLGIMEYCLEAQQPEDIDAYINEQLPYYPTVFTPVEFRSFLEKSGALEFLPAEDDSFEEDPAAEVANAATDGEEAGEETAEPVLYATDFPVDEDGFLIPAPERAGLWQTTEDGKSYLASLNYHGRLTELFQDEPENVEIYCMILAFCDEEPRTIATIGTHIEDVLRAQQSRKNPGFFVERLESRDALKWEKNWTTTKVGKDFLEQRNAND